MAKCVSCGAEGPFVRVDDRGLCVICRKKQAAPEPPAPRTPTVTARDLDPEAVLLRYLTTAHDTYPSEYHVVDYYLAEFECMLDAVPSVPIERIPCDAPGGVPECVILKSLDGCNLAQCGNFVAIDTETSSLGTSAEIVEVSAVRFEKFRPVAVFETLCKPYGRISPEATAVNGISNEDVKNAPRFAEIIPALDDFTDRLPLVAHNAPFDLRMLASEAPSISQERSTSHRAMPWRRRNSFRRGIVSGRDSP